MDYVGSIAIGFNFDDAPRGGYDLVNNYQIGIVTIIDIFNLINLYS